jgi:hypothetical protein
MNPDSIHHEAMPVWTTHFLNNKKVLPLPGDVFYSLRQNIQKFFWNFIVYKFHQYLLCFPPFSYFPFSIEPQFFLTTKSKKSQNLFKNPFEFRIWAHLRRKTPQTGLSAPIPRSCFRKPSGIPGARERPLQSNTSRKATVFGRISATIPCAAAA